MILETRVLSASAHSLTYDVRKGSMSHLLVLKDERIFSTSSLETGLKGDRVLQSDYV